MFPKNGENVPMLRFANFKGDWIKRKLGELGEIFTGNTPSTIDTENWSSNNKGYTWVTPTDINKLLISNSARCLTEKGWSKARIVPANSVLITSIASIGKNAINIVPTAFNQQINAIVPKENDAYFVLSAMEKDTVRFARIAGKTATPIINKKLFEAFTIYVPEYKEQLKIGQLLNGIDNLISLYQQKVYNIILQKKIYLQLIFI
jgi:Restriction endonuclease S subunits